ncbi:MAG: hypothetical protein E1N59_2265 [Puniceicoccaceae bacterium 5H]|nr:MAG: hypothetical protein E1N59_2265 [Puniceicoccaceae bacterium 5H]
MKTCLLTLLALLPFVSTAHASPVNVTANYEFIVREAGGGDAYGIANSKWTFEFSTSQSTYVEAAFSMGDTSDSAPAFTWDSITLTIQGGNYAGTYALSALPDVPSYALVVPGPMETPVLIPAATQNDSIPYAAFQSDTFAFYHGFLYGEVGGTQPAVGDHFSQSDLNVSSYSVVPDYSILQFAELEGDSSVAYQFIVVPEPTTYAAFGGLAALGLIAWRRRRA